ncbi:MAG: error-prone DNA polymerase [Pyrinomonadaceae bacterium]
MAFHELHTRSAFSFLSSGSLPEMLAQRAADLGLPSVALLDRDTVAGAVRFHFEAKEYGINPIIGAEITMDDGSLLPLVPLNLNGYQNLSKLITTVKLRHKKGEHFATRKDIEEYSADLLCFTGGADGFMHNSIKSGRGQADIAWLNYVFEKRLYVELQRHYLRSEEDINLRLLGLAHKLHIPAFASNGAYYADENDRELYDVFTCIKNHCTIYEAGKLLSQNSERYLKSEKQMRDLFEDYPESVDQTHEIASRINFSMDELSYNFPDYKVRPGETMDSVLRAKAIERAVERYRHCPWPLRSQVTSRLEKEFRVIEMKKLAGYFLMVSDISDFCRDERILSQGRGSAANSVVCYALGITAVEPIANKLLFERFLSEKYEQYPDIDIDLPSGDDREKVIQHVYGKYGLRSAGMTANVICYRGKSAIREVGKTFGFDEEMLGQLSKLNAHYEMFTGKELNQRLKEEGFDPADSFKLRKFSEMYSRILDYPRHLGQHSGGMVVSWERLDGIVPLEPASMVDRRIIQWDKDDCEQLKIVKIDLLGLGMMAVLRDTITLVREHHGEELDLYKIPHDDDKVYEALQNADTVGMFQVESRAQIAFLPKSKPRTFYDIVVQVAIIRPGPIVGNMLKSYLARRQGFEAITYPHPSLKPTLERTLGVPLFQEQLLKIAMDIAGFTGSQAEELRRAMGFKRPDRRMEQIEANLRAGMNRNNINQATQDTIVTCVKAFANYGFPESHAYSFALLSYASAYFMVHYRACFMAAMFNNYPLGFYSAATLVKDAQRHGLHFLPIDINRSQYLFTVEEVEETGDGSQETRVRTGSGSDRVTPEKRVRVGLKYVRGLREEIGLKIVEERNAEFGTRNVESVEKAPNIESSQPGESQPDVTNSAFHIPHSAFQSVEDLIRRVPEINKREIRSLSLAGALNFDGTVHRREALWQSELAIQPTGPLFDLGIGNSDLGFSNDGSREADQIPDSNGSKSAIRNPQSASEKSQIPNPESQFGGFLKRMEGIELVDADLRKTGISIGKHPMAFVRDEMTELGILSAHQSRNLRKGQVVSVAGAVIIRQRPMTANNVVFITLEDETGFANFVVMPDMFERFRAVINQSNFLIIRGVFEERGMLKAISFKPLDELKTEVVSHDFR